MKIIYFAGGNRIDTLETIVQNSDFVVTQIYVTDIETNIEDYRAFAKKHAINFIVANKKNITDLFEYHDEEILLSVGYRFIIPEAVFSIPTYAINIHPSLLPKYKGAYSGFAIIENGETKTGLTAHFIDRGIDTGDIIYQVSIPLYISDTIVTMGQKISIIEADFVVNVLTLIKNRNYKRVVQKKIDNEKIFNTKRYPNDSEVNSELSLNKLIHQIRACNEDKFPAYFFMENYKIKIKVEFEEC